ncbi:uncharacterized protein ATNIH1004_003557 [Aspergillus tanneri]|uniref:DUF7082 domain-containing protein n=1 Tax=Aspergillus tanneri TaxID=1220188 RepID=A0A5M9MVG4_9EURO|nr:uncharacterized protein ATNIH1004_003557 [Aspergillus tanneri]KAA8650868.1 hypothetical protein ATNIH1004_003557 [Aspergillus tanneri]
MAEKWTKDECKSKRRLVQFTRAQTGNMIHVDFRAVAFKEYAQNSFCISCIYWDDKKEYFVTGVDIIHLLQALVAFRFTLQEKNRIRRNLESFKPLTVSRASSNYFFEVIMGFPTPKPRSLMREVKVFPWKALNPALTKVISKYSVSHSLGTNTLPAPISSYRASNHAVSDF